MAKNLIMKVKILRNILESFEKTEAKAVELSKKVPPASIFVAICGAEIESDLFEIFDEFVTLRRVTNPPGIIHIAGAANHNQSDYLGVGRYSPHIQAEITVGNPDIQCETSFLFGVAWHMAAMLKLKSTPALFCPVAATISWDTISAVSDNSVNFYMLDDFPRQISLGSKTLISLNSIKWTKLYWKTAFELRNSNSSRRFGLAFNNMYTWNQTTDPRIALANIWVGLEALFGKQDDKYTTEALARRISEWLPSRRDIDVVELYGQRCDAVHGRWLDKKEIWYAIKKSESLLSSALIKCIEKDMKPLPDWK